MLRSTLKFYLSIVVILWLGCGQDEIPEKELETAVPVKTVQVTVQPIDQELTFTGTVKPMDQVRLSTKIMGWIEEIYFEEGAHVEKGATLVKLRSKEFEAKLAQAKAAISEAEANFKNVKTNLKRIKALYEKKAATQKELDDMQAAFASAQARKNAAEEMKKEVQEMLKYTTLTSPFDGVVTRKMMEVGDLASPGQPILEVENMNRVKIVAKVPESQVELLDTGMPVEVQVRASRKGTNGKSLTNTIDQILPSADPMSRQFDVHVLIDNSERLIKTGMFARIVAGKSGGSAILVPKTAIFRRGQLEGLFTVDSENRAHLRWVRSGVEQDGLIEVLSGVNPGEQVVVEGASGLVDGKKVEVVQ
ncbi:efflux RND transporter periplasmic adaptor subunit [candidate division KSB1 bacterium]|nr:efflux RND transporter periplasmic adaptor subunit [candidate division KSB1 bacterium]